MGRIHELEKLVLDLRLCGNIRMIYVHTSPVLHTGSVSDVFVCDEHNTADMKRKKLVNWSIFFRSFKVRVMGAQEHNR